MAENGIEETVCKPLPLSSFFFFLEVLLVYYWIFFWSVWEEVGKECLGRLPTRNHCSAHLNSAMPWSPFFLSAYYMEGQKLKGLLRGTEKEKRGEGFNTGRAGPQPQKAQGGALWHMDTASASLFSSISSRKADLAEWDRRLLLVWLVFD